jgi:hypothetical protein
VQIYGVLEGSVALGIGRPVFTASPPVSFIWFVRVFAQPGGNALA